MIQLKREDAMSIKLLFDKEGLSHLLNSFKKVFIGELSIIDVQLDSAVITLKKRSIENVSIKIEYTESSSTQIYKQNNEIIWSLEQEDIEDAIYLLEQCIVEGYFSPAEFIRVKVPKNKKLDYIYCELMED
ncbi:MAG TPA: hypothetical protein GX727_00690 [Clostridium sp.]|jgi:hypothetical protein|nr:hypothetical protein [Clostridium sp.]